jgi:hypothetical protein
LCWPMQILHASQAAIYSNESINPHYGIHLPGHLRVLFRG